MLIPENFVTKRFQYIDDIADRATIVALVSDKYPQANLHLGGSNLPHPAYTKQFNPFPSATPGAISRRN